MIESWLSDDSYVNCHVSSVNDDDVNFVLGPLVSSLLQQEVRCLKWFLCRSMHAPSIISACHVALVLKLCHNRVYYFCALE